MHTHNYYNTMTKSTFEPKSKSSHRFIRLDNGQDRKGNCTKLELPKSPALSTSEQELKSFYIVFIGLIIITFIVALFTLWWRK